LKHPEEVRALALSPDGTILAAGGQEGTVLLWELATGKEVASLRGKSDLPMWGRSALAFSLDGKTLAVGGGTSGVPSYGELRLWNIAERRLIRTLGGVGSREFRIDVCYTAFTPDGKALTAGSFYDTIRTWQLPELKLRTSWSSRVLSLRDLAYSPGGDFLVVAAAQRGWNFVRDAGELRFVDAANGKLLHVIKNPDYDFHHVTFSPDGRYLAARSEFLAVWDVSAIGRLPDQAGHASPIRISSPRSLLGSGLEKDLSESELKALWRDLGGEDARQSYKAIWRLAAAPDRTVAFLTSRLKPAAPADLNQIAQLLRDLDSSDYGTRSKSAKELAQLGDAAGPALRCALKDNPTLELRKRVEHLLTKLDEVPPPDRLQALRAVEALEMIGTPEARRLLADLAKGAPEDRLTCEALSSLRRLLRPDPATGK
jgi:WD40 repeat protein